MDPVDLPPGDYEVVLEPECVGDLLHFLLTYGFNGRAVAEGRSFVRVGERQFDPALRLWDAPTDPRSTALPYDAEGTPRGRLDLVADGVSAAVVHDRRTAAEAGTGSTGNAVEGGERLGPMATQPRVAAGAGGTAADLAAGMRRGLLVSDFWYTRVLDPRTVVVTGLTRNGVWLVEDGEVVSPVSTLRFTPVLPGGGRAGRGARGRLGPGAGPGPRLGQPDGRAQPAARPLARHRRRLRLSAAAARTRSPRTRRTPAEPVLTARQQGVVSAELCRSGAQRGDDREVGRQPVHRVQVGRGQPAQLGVLGEGRLAGGEPGGPDPQHQAAGHQHVRADPGADLDLDGQLLAQLADQGLRLGLPRLHLAAGNSQPGGVRRRAASTRPAASRSAAPTTTRTAPTLPDRAAARAVVRWGDDGAAGPGCDRRRAGRAGRWAGEPDGINRAVELASFPAAIAVVDRVAEAAEEADHHPDIDIRWRTLTFTLATHSAGGVTGKDVRLATRIDEIVRAAG